MVIIRSSLFDKFDNIVFGFSTKIGLDRKPPYNFDLSYSVGDAHEMVTENRVAFFSGLGITDSEIAFQKQVHSDKIMFVENPGINGESDALITNKKGLGLAISSADCSAVFIYDRKNEVLAAIHSGWRGTSKKIVQKTLSILSMRAKSKPENLYAYISPSISQKNYEVGIEVAEKFDEKFVKDIDGKLFLDVTGANYEMLINFGIPKNQIQKSKLCSFGCEKLLHSYRREGQESGRALGVIAMKADK